MPVRAIGEALGKTVDWDGPTNTIYIGARPGESAKKTLLSDLTPSAKNGYELFDVINDSFGNVYRNCATLKNIGNSMYVEYLLDKQYTTLTLTIVPSGDKYSFRDDQATKLRVDGDSKNLWTSDMLDYKTRPVTIEIDVTGQDYIRFSTTGEWMSEGYIIIGNATLS